MGVVVSACETWLDHRPWCHQSDAECMDSDHTWSLDVAAQARCSVNLSGTDDRERPATVYVGLHQSFGDVVKVRIETTVEGGVVTIDVLPGEATALRDGLVAALDRLAASELAAS